MTSVLNDAVGTTAEAVSNAVDDARDYMERHNPRRRKRRPPLKHIIALMIIVGLVLAARKVKRLVADQATEDKATGHHEGMATASRDAHRWVDATD